MQIYYKLLNLLEKNNVLTSLFSHNSTQVINLIAQIYIVSKIAPEKFGIYIFILTFFEFFTSLIGASLNQAVIQIRQVRAISSNSVFLCLCFSLLIFIFTLIFYFFSFFEKEINNLFLIIGISKSLSLLPGLILSLYFDRLTQFHISSNIRLISSIISSAIGIYLVNLNYDIFSLIFKELISSLLIIIITLYLIKFKFSFMKIYKETIIKLCIFCINRSILRSSEILFYKLPIIIIGLLYGNFLLGLFSQAIYLVTITVVFFQRIFDIALAFYSKSNDEKSELIFTNVNNILFSLSIIISILLFFYSDLAINFIYGNKWNGLDNFFKFLCFLNIFYIMIFSAETYLISLNKFKVITYFYLLSTILQILLFVLFNFYNLSFLYVFYISFIILTIFLKEINYKNFVGIFNFKNIILFLIIISINFSIKNNLIDYNLNLYFSYSLGVIFTSIIYLLFFIKDLKKYYLEIR